MATMKPRQKWVAELADAHLSYAEVAAILGHEIVASKQGDESIIEWRTEYESVKTDVLLSVLAAKRFCMFHPNGKHTCFKFNRYDSDRVSYRDGKEVYDYMFWASISLDDKTAIDCVLVEHVGNTDRVIARMTLDEDYMMFLDALDFEGSEEEWGRVED